MTSDSRSRQHHPVITPEAQLRLRPVFQQVVGQRHADHSAPTARKKNLKAASFLAEAPPELESYTQEEASLATLTLALRRQRDIPPLEAMSMRPPAERQYLDTAGLKAFGASKKELQAVKAFVRKKGLKIVKEYPIAALVVVGGTPEKLAATFLSQDSEYITATVPPELADIVRWIFGLDDRVTSRPRFHMCHKEGALPQEIAEQAWLKELLVPKGHTAPTVARFYDYPELLGDGQCLGLLQLSGGVEQSDLNEYFKSLKIDPPPKIVYLGGKDPSSRGRFNLEVTFDIALVGAVCPRAKIVVYNSQDVSVNGILVALCMAIFDDVHRPSVLSLSWSFPELPGQGPTKVEAEIFDEVLALAAWKGISVCMSSGDSGALTPTLDMNGKPTALPTANFPSTNPYVLSCGGTTLEVVDGTVRGEHVWNSLTRPMLFLSDPNDTQARPYPMATGGGISRFYELPDYQQCAGVPPLVDCYWYIGTIQRVYTFRGRGTPDVAANADWMTGYDFVFMGDWQTVGGTSAAAPMWASLLTLINEGLEANHGPGTRVGWLNPLLYQLRLGESADVCRPITHGNNGGYQAHPERGWNPCTGLGSPNGKQLARALGAAPVEEVRRQKRARALAG